MRYFWVQAISMVLIAAVVMVSYILVVDKYASEAFKYDTLLQSIIGIGIGVASLIAGHLIAIWDSRRHWHD